MQEAAQQEKSFTLKLECCLTYHNLGQKFSMLGMTGGILINRWNAYGK